jgi:hypothetical protein
LAQEERQKEFQKKPTFGMQKKTVNNTKDDRAALMQTLMEENDTNLPEGIRPTAPQKEETKPK